MSKEPDYNAAFMWFMAGVIFGIIIAKVGVTGDPWCAGGLCGLF